MENKTPLREWLQATGHSQQQIAEAAGIRQSAVSKMLRVGREVYVVVKDGRVRLGEWKWIGDDAA